MKVKELAERLSQYPPDAEIGYEHMDITYSYQENDNYVEIGGSSVCKQTVYMPIASYLSDDRVNILGVYSTKERACEVMHGYMKDNDDCSSVIISERVVDSDHVQYITKEPWEL